MDSVSSYKKKLASFRIKELKDVLRQLGVSRQGKKQELVDRIEAFLLKEVSNAEDSTKKNFIVRGVAAIIDDVYRELQGAGLTSASMNGENFVEINNMKPKEEVVDKKVRCPCGSSLATDYMIQCSDRQCLVLQHICCVVIPEEEYSEAIPPLPSQFYCEICRINRADPFWVTVAYPLSPVKLIASNNPADGTNPLQSVEGTFQLTAADIDLLQNMEYDVQAWCILLNDKVPFRMQWPLYADLKVNGVPVKTMSRPGSHLLGANGRDDGPMIAFYIGEEINRISLSGCDARSFCLGVRLVKRRTIEQILNLILDEQNAEPLEDALVRVRCCIGGGMATAYEDSDSDSDLEVIADCVTVNLRCPMSGSRIKTAGRFRSCVHMGCFDLETFVQINQRSRKWQCPICLKNYSLEDITIDPYFNRITKMVQDCGEDLTEIDVKPDGSWRLRNGCQFKYLEQWHLPDGSLCDSTLGIGLNLEASKHLKEEGIVGHITPKQLSKPRDTQITSRNQLGEYFEKCSPTIITMSSSSSQSHRDDEVCSVNQVGFGNFDKAANNNHEVNTISLGSMNVIVLSDSEEENANLTTVETPCITRAVDNGGHSFPAPPAFANVYAEDPVLHARASSLGLVNSNDNDFEISRQAFDSDNVSGTLIHSEFTPFSSSAPVDGYIVPSKCTIDSDRKVFGSSMCHSNTKINDSLVINPLAFVCADPHVQTLPPTQSSGQIMHFDQGIDHLTSNGTCGESLGGNSGVGNGVAGIHAKPATSNGLDLVNQLESNKGLLLPSMNDEVRSNGTTNRKRSYGPFSFPRQPRSAIPRQPRSARRPRLS